MADAAGGPAGSTLLLTFTGRDHPGVTAAVFAALAAHPVAVLDVEQVVVRGRLVLAVLVTAPEDEAVLRTGVEVAAAEAQVDVEVEPGTGDSPPARRGRLLVTVIAHPLTPGAVAAVAAHVAASGGNIDRIVRLAAYPVTSIELAVSGAQAAALREALATGATALGVDVAVQPAGLARRAKRLVVMDVDSTLVQGEVVEMLAARAGTLDAVAAVTAEAMRGELEFEASLRSRVALLAGLDAADLDAVRQAVRLAPGARTLVRTLKRLGYRCALVSGGFTQVIDPIAAELDIDYAAANTLEVVDGRLTGRLVGPVVDRAGKAAALRRFAAQAGVPLGQTVAIGDGANDLDMIATAGLGVAFNAKPVVRSAADTALSVPYLDTVLYLLGISREDVEEADAADEAVPAPS